MKVTRHKANELNLELSPVTRGGDIVYSRIEKSKDFITGEAYITTYTPGRDEAVKVLSFLDEINGIGWSSELTRIEKELRSALFELMGYDD